ncbi:c-type cytochrome [Rhodocyclus tenuis]|uniref:c-type cytochrome n=1 Tax=Rhodocyclus tenuis TaxID=1066 RepID=UPI001908C845|nr:c-type cytochrome [Rhodocyclus tenuis]MBK1680772.1 cytochrome C [Rhodocyclus tenuis]
MNRYLLALLALCSSGLVLAATAEVQPHAPGIESADYIWNEMDSEKLLALRAKVNLGNGKVAFEVCQGCHRANALGREDGSYPRLAAQHDTVLIKQMSDIRAGRRDNPKMYPFVNEHVIEAQEIADIAGYLQSLPSPASNGKGPGADLETGKTIYEKRCVSCHEKDGSGSAEKLYPRVNGQHFAYLLRQNIDIRDGVRRNSNPKMVRVIRQYSDEELKAVADYMSRLPPPTVATAPAATKMQKAPAGAR